jgi:NAD(P)-dependent dehydrogenase (short-subunit alcohol dehydrogenase family)
MTETRLAGRVALVTGGRRGIGKGISLRLAALGCDVAIVARHEASELVSEIEALGRKARTYAIDVANAEAVFATVEQIISHFHQVDILVNNAGIADMAPFLETTPGMLSRTLDVNLKGTFFFSQAVARHMKERRYGKIVNIHSNAAILGYGDLAAYCASKGAIAALTLAMAVELGPYNINVNGVGPGTVKTEMAMEYLAGDREQVEIQATPLRRLGMPEDVAGLVAFLASDDASWVSGQNIYIDGGYSTNGT